MTNQEAFDKAYRALMAQDERSGEYSAGAAREMTEADFSCLYRGPNGTKCAVGHLIPDELYSPELEYSSAAQLMDKRATKPAFCAVRAHFEGVNPLLLTALQRAHDFKYKWENKAAELAEIATSFGLTVPAL